MMDTSHKFQSQGRNPSLLRSPFLWAMATLVAVAFVSLWSWNQRIESRAMVQQAWERVERARKAVLKIHAYRPAFLDDDSGQRVHQLVDESLRLSQAGDTALRSRTVRPMGAVGETGLVRTQLHLEFTSLTQVQVARIIDAFERSPLPISFESVNMAGVGNDRWELSLVVGWLQQQNAHFTQR